MYESAALLHWGAAAPLLVQAALAHLAETLPYVLSAAAVLSGVAILWHRHHDLVAYIAMLGLAAITARLVVVEVVRIFIQTARPFVALSLVPLIDPVMEFSFPSGHVAVLSALAFVAWRASRGAGIALLSGALVVGFARVAVAVHWPLDIVGGVLAGGVAALVSIFLVNHLRRA